MIHIKNRKSTRRGRRPAIAAAAGLLLAAALPTSAASAALAPSQDLWAVENGVPTSCSAAVVNSQHHNVIMTAGHCVMKAGAAPNYNYSPRAQLGIINGVISTAPSGTDHSAVISPYFDDATASLYQVASSYTPPKQ